MAGVLPNNSITDYCMWKDVLIPLICALFSGLVTFLGIFITIKHENKKSRQEYIEKIRPFIVIDSYLTTNADLTKVIDVIVNTEADREEKLDGTNIYRFDSFLFTNCGEAVFMVDYLRINNRVYKTYNKTSIKPNEYAQLHFFPIPVFQANVNDASIRIGVSDRQSNQYEYKLFFEKSDNTYQDSLTNMCKEKIDVISVDCSQNLYNKRCRHNVKAKKNCKKE